MSHLPVLIVQVDVVYSKALQGFRTLLSNILGIAPTSIRCEAELGSKEDLVSLARPLEPGYMHVGRTLSFIKMAYHFPMRSSESP